MAIEIERKFLVADDRWRAGVVERQQIRQGYLQRGGPDGPTVRVRSTGSRGWITVKGRGGLARSEFEYPIPAEDAAHMLATLCRRPLIEKVRHVVPHAGLSWCIDVFGGHLAGLVLAEVELREIGQAVALPPWAGTEVTGDLRFHNSALVLAGGVPVPQGAGEAHPAGRSFPDGRADGHPDSQTP
ncbi:CYTH domain-containing protein [Roseomonas sp. NAR14]|uniref:CYTH domain-containing protein n=1 Tax=Roseomonas acroporae TaxID=2937791 RepID=A0A9X2BY23_9PROT|nr:CYTH domain-containing protein [Roseomonas acroporae]MCK8786524.1 CYTH domain-containing protein [Roseomonas acroporae]